MDRMYTPTPDGYCGDEDNGQTSAWYVFSALGFYPVAPGTTQYVLGAPLFKKATCILKMERAWLSMRRRTATRISISSLCLLTERIIRKTIWNISNC